MKSIMQESTNIFTYAEENKKGEIKNQSENIFLSISSAK
jgi:hypothetical protein